MITIQPRNLMWNGLDLQFSTMKQMPGWHFTWYKNPLLDSHWFTLFLIRLGYWFARHLHLHGSSLPWAINLPVLPTKPWSVWTSYTEHTATISSYSCSPNFDKINVTPCHWCRNSPQKASHSYIHSTSETYVLQRRKALISPAWSFTYSQLQCVCHTYSTMCDLDLEIEVYCHHSTVSTQPQILTDSFWPSEIHIWARFGKQICYLHLTLVWPWPIFKAYFGNQPTVINETVIKLWSIVITKF